MSEEVHPNTGEELYVSKGEFMPMRKLMLSSGKHIRELVVQLGWNVRTTAGPSFDLNAVVFPLTDRGQVPSGRHCVYYNNLVSPERAIVHEGDDPDGSGGGEIVRVHLRELPSNIVKIVFAVVIYEASARHENFGNVEHAYIRFTAEDFGKLDEHELSATPENKFTGVVVGEMVRAVDDWEFHVLEQGYYGGLAEIGHLYGVNFRDVPPPN